MKTQHKTEFVKGVKQEWQFQCWICNKWQAPDWSNFQQATNNYKCPYCRTAFGRDLFARMMCEGGWRPINPKNQEE